MTVLLPTGTEGKWDMSGCTCPVAEPPFAAALALDCPVHGAEARAAVIDAIDAGQLIAEQPPGRCDLCGKVEETRPYGPNGENVCFGCGPGSSDPEAVKAAERAFDNRMRRAA